MRGNLVKASSQAAGPTLAALCLLLAACGGAVSPGPSSPPLHIAGAYRVVVDPAGNLVVPDGVAHRVWRLDPRSGRLSILAGDGGSTLRGIGGPATAASIGIPRDAAVGPDGSVYIAVSSDQVLRVSAAGLLTAVVGTGQKGGAGDGGPAVAALLDGPTAVAVDRFGNLFVAEAAGRIRRIDASTKEITTVLQAVDQPHGVAAAADGSLYVAETGANRVRRLTASGASTMVQAGQLSMPTGVAVSGGDLLIADFGNNRIQRVSPSGTIATFVESVVGPTGVAVAEDGTIYVSELDWGLVRIDRSGRRTPIG